MLIKNTKVEKAHARLGRARCAQSSDMLVDGQVKQSGDVPFDGAKSKKAQAG